MTDLVQAQTTLAQAVLSYINQLQDYNNENTHIGSRATNKPKRIMTKAEKRQKKLNDIKWTTRG